jgi:hypothetical protein
VQFKRVFINALMFNVAWLGCVLMGNAFIAVVLAWLVLHLYYSECPTAEIRFITLVTFIGCVIDSALMHFGVFIFFEHALLLPWWLLFIWVSFALTINASLRFFQVSVVLQLVIGLVVAPLSYFAGNALGAVKFGYSNGVTFVILSFVWAVLLPFIFYLNQFIKAGYHVNHA